MSRANASAASEDAVGKLHNSITKAFTHKVEDMLIRHENAEDEIERALALDDKALSAAAKWVQMNEVTCSMPAKDGKSSLSKNLDKVIATQSGNVIQFVQEG